MTTSSRVSDGYEDFSRALTCYQPVATAMVQGPKWIENRTRPPPKRLINTYFWIHAGAELHEGYWEFVEERWPELNACTLPYKAIVGCALLAACVDSEGNLVSGSCGIGRSGPQPEDIPKDPWWVGPYGWVLHKRIALDKPVPCRGFQGVWTVPEKERGLALAQLQTKGHLL